MTTDFSSLTVDDLTPEIMAQMGPSDIAAFKAKLTPEEIQALAEKLGSSTAASPEVPGEDIEMPSIAASSSEDENTEEGEEASETPTTQTGPVIFGRK